MTRKLIKCAITTDTGNIENSNKRKILQRFQELQQQGVPMDEIKKQLESEVFDRITKGIKDDMTKFYGSVDRFKKNFYQRLQERDVNYFGIKKMSKEQAAERAFLDMIEGDTRYKDSLHHQIEGMQNATLSDISAQIRESVSKKEYEILFENNLFGKPTEAKQKIFDNVQRELFNNLDGKTSDKTALKIADILKKYDERFVKERLLAHGISAEKISKRSPYAQNHSREVLKKVGSEKWIDDVVKLGIDNEKTFGVKNISETELRSRLGDIYNRIINPNQYMNLNGTDMEARMFGDFATAEKQHQIFFSNADNQISYNKAYNNNQNVIKQFMNSFKKYNKLLALQDNFGANPFSTIALMANKINNDLGLNIGIKYNMGRLEAANGSRSGDKIVKALNMTLDSYKLEDNAITKLSKISKDLNYANSLGKLAISSFSDTSGIAAIRSAVTGENLSTLKSVFDIFNNYSRLFSKEKRTDDMFDMHAMGVGLQSILDDATYNFLDSGINTGSIIGSPEHLSKRISNFATKLSLMDKVQFAHEKSSLGYQSAIADALKNDKIFGENGNKYIKKSLEQVGINEKDAQMLKFMMEKTANNKEFFAPYKANRLTSEQIQSVFPELKTDSQLEQYRYRLGQKAQTFLTEIVNNSMNYKSAKTRRQMMLGTSQGTTANALVDASLSFKSFVWEFLNNHIDRMINGFDSKGEQAKFIGQFAFSSIATGYATLAIKDILDNKTPRWFFDDDDNLNKDVVLDVLNYSGLTAIHGEVAMGLLGFGKSRFQEPSVSQTIFGPTGGKVIDTAKSIISGSYNALDGEDDKANKEVAKALRTMYKILPFNNNLVLDTAMAYFADKEIYPINKMTDNYFIDTEEKGMQKRGQKRITDIE